MSSVILVILEQSASAARLLQAAATLADLVGEAVIHGLIIRTSPEATIMPSEEVLTSQRADSLRQQETARAAALTGAFEQWRQQAQHPVRLDEVEGMAGDLVARLGAAADFVALAGPGPGALGADRPALHSALFITDRPVLLLPQGAGVAFGRTVAIAWRDDGRAIKAVLPVLRLLTRAAAVHLLQGVRGEVGALPVPAVFQDHGVAAEMHVLPIGDDAFGQSLLDAAHALGADLLVMGAYGHNPLRELIFGGVTRYMLEHADLPVLMRH